jgi:hypothetical protein
VRKHSSISSSSTDRLRSHFRQCGWEIGWGHSVKAESWCHRAESNPQGLRQLSCDNQSCPMQQVTPRLVPTKSREVVRPSWCRQLPCVLERDVLGELVNPPRPGRVRGLREPHSWTSRLVHRAPLLLGGRAGLGRQRPQAADVLWREQAALVPRPQAVVAWIRDSACGRFSRPRASHPLPATEAVSLPALGAEKCFAAPLLLPYET